MVTVHVWPFRATVPFPKVYEFRIDAWGHASLHVDSTYISWWPEAEGRVGKKMVPNVYSANPIRNRSFEDDEEAEAYEEQMANSQTNQSSLLQKAQKTSAFRPVELIGLDEQAIKDWWAGFGLVKVSETGGGTQQLYGPLPPWSTISENCSTVVARALIIGGGEKATTWRRPFYSPMWTPNQVHDFAVNIRLGLEAKRR
jgi:hypothetical protein